MTLPEKLKKARQHLGKSQSDMAAALGMSSRGWQAYESGKSIPGGQVFEALAQMGFNANWFFVVDVPMLRGDLPSGHIDQERLVAAIETLEEALAATRKTMQPDKKAELIMEIYDFFGDSAEDEARGKVLRLIKHAI